MIKIAATACKAEKPPCPQIAAAKFPSQTPPLTAADKQKNKAALRKETPKTKTTVNPTSASARWKQIEKGFQRQKNELLNESDSNRRSKLIARMSHHVRFDTLSTIEWAMSLTDPEERIQALEALNRNALIGIGARILPDETGYPLIHEMTLLGAMETSEIARVGDYILGMEDSDGQWTSFQNMPMKEIIQYLRGEAGTKVHLLMGSGTSQNKYEITTQRSMIVMQPPD